MKVICLDTSAINNLCDDPESDALTRIIVREYDVYVSTLNILEVAKTKDPVRREQLRSFLKVLGRDVEPLDLPNHLVRQVCCAFAGSRTRFTWSVTGDRRAFWMAMSEPDSLGETERAEAIEWTKSLESGNHASNKEFREELEINIFGTGRTPRPRSPAHLFRIYLAARWPLRYSIPSQVFKIETGRVLPLSKLDTLLEARPSVWPLYLMAYAFSVYYGAMWTADLGPRNRVGLIDLLYSVYLPICDVFVTHDTANGGQFGALRVLNSFNSRRPRTHILSWSQLRARLVAAG